VTRTDSTTKSSMSSKILEVLENDELSYELAKSQLEAFYDSDEDINRLGEYMRNHGPQETSNSINPLVLQKCAFQIVLCILFLRLNRMESKVYTSMYVVTYYHYLSIELGSKHFPTHLLSILKNE